MSNAIMRPFPGYITLKHYELKRKVGGFTISSGVSDDAPQLGEVMEVGAEINKMPYDAKNLPKAGDIIGYKKYNAFKFEIGTEVCYLVSFDNILFQLESGNVEA